MNSQSPASALSRQSGWDQQAQGNCPSHAKLGRNSVPFWNIFLNMSGPYAKRSEYWKIETIPDLRPISTNESSSLFTYGNFQDLKNFSMYSSEHSWLY